MLTSMPCASHEVLVGNDAGSLPALDGCRFSILGTGRMQGKDATDRQIETQCEDYKSAPRHKEIAHHKTERKKAEAEKIAMRLVRQTGE